MMNAKAIEDFVCDNKGFVDPEKAEAVEIYGLEKAREMWRDGAPDFAIRNNLRIIAMQKALLGLY